jgi:hypothetical protein
MNNTYWDEEHDIDIVIAPRQSGKTTMLVNNAIQYVINNDNDVYIVLPNIHIREHTRSILMNIISDLSFKRDIIRYINFIDMNWFNTYFNHFNHISRIYFDESDLMHDIPLIKNAYYTTTSTTGRTNSFINVLESGEYNVFGRRLASIIPMDFEIARINFNPRIRTLTPDEDDNFTIENVDDETLYLYRIGG